MSGPSRETSSLVSSSQPVRQLQALRWAHRFGLPLASECMKSATEASTFWLGGAIRF